MKTQIELIVIVFFLIVTIIFQGCEEKSSGLTITSTTIYPPYYGEIIYRPTYDNESFGHPRFVNSDSIIFTEGFSGEGHFDSRIAVLNTKTNVVTVVPNSSEGDFADVRNGTIIFGTNSYSGPIRVIKNGTVSVLVDGDWPCFNDQGSAFVYANSDSLFIFSFADSSHKLLYVGGYIPECDEHTIYFQYSSSDGSDNWYHIYSIPDTGGTPTQLTSGSRSDFGPRADKGNFVFTRGVYNGNYFDYSAIIQNNMSVVLTLPALGGDPEILNDQILYTAGDGLHIYKWK